jgi:hypothetical protein
LRLEARAAAEARPDAELRPTKLGVLRVTGDQRIRPDGPPPARSSAMLIGDPTGA